MFIYFILILLFSIIRLYIGSNLQIWAYNGAQLDDLLLFQHSNLSWHFNNWDILTLTKPISYSLFLSFVNFTNIPYAFWISLLWVVAGLLTAFSVYKYINNNKIVCLLIFVFIIFSPISFDFDITLRAYRNSIIAPFVLITLSALFIFVNRAISKPLDRKTTIIAIAVGLVFLFTYYIKEDSIVLLLMLIAFCAVILLFNILKNYKDGDYKRLLKIAVICVIPLIIFAAGTFAYKEVNNHYFGVSEINTRNDGELGKFWQNLLKIEDSNKTPIIEVPASTVDKAWNASPTLQSRPDLRDSIMHTNWWDSYDLYKNPLTGDQLSWAMRYSLKDVGLYENEKTANDFFKNVNDELEAAFNSGELKKSDKIFITSSLDGKNMEEIKALKPLLINGIEVSLFYSYAAEPLLESDMSINQESKDTAYLIKDIINDNTLLKNQSTDSNVFASEFSKLDLSIYQTISPIIVLLSVVGFICLFISQIIARFKNKCNNLLLFYEIVIVGAFAVYLIAVAWFSAGVITYSNSLAMKIYTVSSQSLWLLFEVYSIAFLIGFVRKRFFKNCE